MNTVKVTGQRIMGTSTTVYEAYEPSSVMGNHSSSHSTITMIDGEWYGKIATRRLPADINAMPIGPERSAAVDAFHKARYAEAYAAIESSGKMYAASYATIKRTYGDIEVTQ